VEPIGCQHRLPGASHLPGIGQHIGGAGTPTGDNAGALGQRQTAEREDKDKGEGRHGRHEADIHVHLEFPKVKVGASGWQLEDTPEVLEHPEGKKDDEMSQAGFPARLKCRECSEELFLSAQANKAAIVVATSKAQPIGELSVLVPQGPQLFLHRQLSSWQRRKHSCRFP
jgi:hypothetical protein